ncbi:MAG: hypothetical protein VKK43_07175, partial [Synechococcaceae cyanobacterium]|nr:hypothetical protein [Synechococcaceae cyanobacterium]
YLLGGTGSDQLLGGEGNDLLNGEAGNDLLNGGAGDDVYILDSSGDRILEATMGGTDQVRSATIAIDLNSERLAHVENGLLLGGAALQLSGSDTANRLIGNSGDNVIRGRAGADLLTGGAGRDQFILEESFDADTITDYRSRTDTLMISQAGLPIGNGDTIVNNAQVRGAPGGFASGAELVIFSRNISGPITTDKAATTIRGATSAYSIASQRLFAVDNGRSSALYLFTAANNDATVSASELRLLGTLSTTTSLSLSDLQFIA